MTSGISSARRRGHCGASIGSSHVVLAPHYAAVTAETRFGIANTLAGAIRDLRAGKPVPNAARKENA
jgi:phosphoglycerate dehydrogenase-like enzyme